MGFLSSVGKAISSGFNTAKSVLSGGVGDLAGSLGGSLITGAFNAKSAKDQMKFQERMSNTSYQRAVADMRKAGINPILAASRGGASSPGGAGYSYPDMGQAVQTASSARQMREQTKKVPTEIDLLKEQIDTAESVQNLNFNQANKEYTQSLLNDQLNKRTVAETKNLEKQNRILDYDVERTKTMSEIERSQFGEIMRYWDRVFGAMENSGKGIRNWSRK